jgi:hypothetical protein
MQYNTEEKPTPNKFLSIQSNYSQAGYGGYRQSPLTATSSSFAGSPFSADGASPSPAVSPQGPILPLKTQNVAALDAATGAGGAFGTWRSKRVHGPGQ